MSMLFALQQLDSAQYIDTAVPLFTVQQISAATKTADPRGALLIAVLDLASLRLAHCGT